MEESILVNEISNWSMKFLGLTFKGSKFRRVENQFIKIMIMT